MFTQLFVVIAESNYKLLHKTVSNEEEFVKFISKNERKATYYIQVNQIKSDEERASFMDGLFASSIVVVVSRPDDNGILTITAPNQFTTEQVKQEVESILVASKSKTSKDVQKNK
jgi:hypothetical protein